jgi:4-amino-4-deoxychorismate lyase
MILVDGEPRSSVPADDRGLAYGDGVFETVAVIAGRPALWALHLQRLRRGCHTLGIQAPPPAALDADLARLFPDGGDGVLKIIVTRGSGGRGYAPPEPAVPRRVSRRGPRPGLDPGGWRTGIDLHLCQTRLPPGGALAGIKHLNRLPQVLARQEWSDPHIAEGLMLGENGAPVEATAANLFARFGSRLVTPPGPALAVAGVMRERILELAPDVGLDCEQAALSWGQLAAADELFLTNAVVGAWPVRRVADLVWRRPGAAAAGLQRRLVAEGSIFDWHEEGRGRCVD